MNTIWTKAFWQATGERAVTAFAASLASGFAVGTGLFSWDWQAAVSVAAGAAVVSLLKSLVVNNATGTGPGITEMTNTAAADKADQAVIEETARQGRLKGNA